MTSEKSKNVENVIVLLREVDFDFWKIRISKKKKQSLVIRLINVEKDHFHRFSLHL